MGYFNQIQYIKTAISDSRDKTVLLSDGSLLNLKNVKFDTLLKELPEADFCRINKKEISSTAVFNCNEITPPHY